MSKWWAGWDYIEVEVAEHIYGVDAVRNATRYDILRENADYIENGQYVRVLEYFDVGFGDSEPTMITWIGSILNEPIEAPSANLYDCIPVAFGVGFTAPGKRYADGRIYNQLSSQDARRAIVEHIKDTLAYHAVDVFDEQLMESQDWQDLVDGQRRIRGSISDLKGKTPWLRIPAQEVANTTLEYFRIVMEEYNMASGLAEFDRANTVSKGRSATEMAIMDSRLKMNQALSVGQTMLYQRQLAIVHEKVALLGDYHPRTLNIRGRNMPINEKGVPESWVGRWLEEEAEILISQESMTADEDQVRRLATVEKLMRLAPFAVPGGSIDQDWWIRELVESSGFDVDQALAKRDPQAAVQQLASQMSGGGTPMQNPGVAPPSNSSQPIGGGLPPGDQFANAG
jgi:hypothetical protein